MRPAAGENKNRTLFRLDLAVLQLEFGFSSRLHRVQITHYAEKTVTGAGIGPIAVPAVMLGVVPVL